MTESQARLHVLEEFRRFAAAETLDLFEGALLVSRLVDPTEDLAAARHRAASLAARVADRRASGETGIHALRQVLFSEEGFRGEPESYDEPANSSVARVLASGRGMPITLSIATVEIGRRAGLALTGIGLPGHFVIGGAELPPGVYLDPFDSGALHDESALAERVGEIFGTEVELMPEAFAPDPPRAILARVLANLRRSWERRDRFEEALLALACGEALDPGEARNRRERGLLLLKLGRPAEAIADLEAYVEAVSGDDSDAVAKLIVIVRDQGVPSSGAEPETAEPPEKRIFTLEEVREVLPRVREVTSEAVFRYARLGEGGESEEERQGIVRDWAREVLSMGAEIKGLWLVDFDSGAGYYCWKHPEPAVEYFHDYGEGFAGRLPLQ